jgi:hypothetical protein
VGLPVTRSTVSQEFLNFLATPTHTIGLTTSVPMNEQQMIWINSGEKINVTPSWDFLIDSGFKFTVDELAIQSNENIVYMKNRWNQWLTAAEIAEEIADEYAVLNYRYPDSKIALFTTSSPNLWNDVAKNLIPRVPAQNVIDNPHAPDIAYNLLLDFDAIPNEPMNVTDPLNLSIKSNMVNMVGVLGLHAAADLTEFEQIISDNPGASIYKIILSYRNSIDGLTGDELITQLNIDRSSFNNAVVSVVLKN